MRVVYHTCLPIFCSCHCFFCLNCEFLQISTLQSFRICQKSLMHIRLFQNRSIVLTLKELADFNMWIFYFLFFYFSIWLPNANLTMSPEEQSASCECRKHLNKSPLLAYFRPDSKRRSDSGSAGHYLYCLLVNANLHKASVQSLIRQVRGQLPTAATRQPACRLRFGRTLVC